MHTAVRSLLLLSAFVAGCGIPNIENRVSITQGVYGQMVGGCDTAGCSPRVITDGEVALFETDVMSGPLTATPLARTAIDGAGFYQLPVPAGHYWLTWLSNAGSGLAVNTSVVEIDLTEGITRWDFESGPGGGRWQER